MRIVHSVMPGAYGGLEEVVIRLARGQRERGHDVHVVVTLTGHATEHPFLSQLEAQGVDAHPVGVTPRGYLSEVRGVRRLAAGLVPEVWHTHGYRPGVLHRLAARGGATSLVTTLHGFTGGGWKNRVYERIQLRSARGYDAVVAVSRAMEPRLARAGLDPRRTHVIPNAWQCRHEPLPPGEARAALGVAAERFHMGWVGRLSREKGPDVFVEACAALGDLPATASIVGDGRLAEELALRVPLHGTVEVRLHGSLPAAAGLMRAFDLFVLSSRTEGTPIVLFEAMEAGVPVVATAVGGVPDILDERTGILVPPEDPRSLADAIRAVRRNPEAARERALLARERLHERHAPGPWIDRHEALYRSLLAAR